VGITVFFSAEDEIKPSKRCCQGFSSKAPSPSCILSLLFPHNNTRMQERKLTLFAVFFTLPLLCFSCLSLAVSFAALFSLFFLLFFCSPPPSLGH